VKHMNTIRTLGTMVWAITLASLMPAATLEAAPYGSGSVPAAQSFDEDVNHSLWHKWSENEPQFFGLIAAGVRLGVTVAARVVPRLGSLAARQAAQAALKAAKPLAKAGLSAKKSGEQAQKLAKAAKEVGKQVKDQAQQSSNQQAQAPQNETLKPALVQAVVADKEYKEATRETNVNAKLFVASLVKTDKAMNADKTVAAFQEVTDESEADALLEEANAAAPAPVPATAAPANSATAQNEKTKSALKNPEQLQKKADNAANTAIQAEKTENAAEKLAQALETRADVLEKAGVGPNEVPPPGTADPQNKAIIADFNAYANDAEDFQKDDQEFNNELMDELDDFDAMISEGMKEDEELEQLEKMDAADKKLDE
jgi:hypothetical protein